MTIFLIIIFLVVLAVFIYFSTQKKKKGTDEYRDTPAAPGETGTESDQDKV